jgi:predicted dithiol-disulfide oxidoreductase (DUF899 family)
MRQTNLTNEPANYPARHDQLRLAEIEPMRQRERVAELRRQLPDGTTIDDYVFQEDRPTWMPATPRPARCG